MSDIINTLSGPRFRNGRQRPGWIYRTRRPGAGRSGGGSATAAAWTPGEASQFDALVAACALVAYADGWITPDERQEVLNRLRRLDAIAVFGIEDALAAFESLTEHMERDLDDGVDAAEAAVRRLRGRPGPARLLVEAACAIAASDGGFDEAERKVILRLCDLVALDPADFDLIVARPADGRRLPGV